MSTKQTTSGGKTLSTCVFCKIIDKAAPAEILYEDENVMAFYGLEFKADTHFLVIPKKHIPSYADVQIEDMHYMIEIHKAIQNLAIQFNLDGYRVLTNCGENGGQEVFHIHFHVLSGKVDWGITNN